MVFRDIKEEAKKALVGNRLMYLFAIIVIMAITSLGSFLAGIGAIISPVLMGGLFILSLSLLEGKTFDFSNVFKLFKDLNHALKMIGVALLTMFIVMLGFLLLIIPGLIFAFQYSQALYVMVENPEIGIWDAMKESKRLMVGHKFELFVFNFSFILHMLLGIITFGLYYFYFIPYFQVSMHNYYKHLRGKNTTNETVEVEFN